MSGSDRTAGDSTTTDGPAVRDFFMAAPLLRGVMPRFGHHSSTTSSDGAAASIFNSQWDIPLDSDQSVRTWSNRTEAPREGRR